MAEHGTRTMYVHYGCRCEECCKAEHAQYLKRPESKSRTRTRSKWSGEYKDRNTKRQEYNRTRNAERWGRLTATHKRPFAWLDIVDSFDGRCAICGEPVDPTDTWTEEDGRKCYGRRYPTVDHILPLKRGGTDTIENVQLACKRCNSRKGASVG